MERVGHDDDLVDAVLLEVCQTFVQHLLGFDVVCCGPELAYYARSSVFGQPICGSDFPLSGDKHGVSGAFQLLGDLFGGASDCPIAWSSFGGVPLLLAKCEGDDANGLHIVPFG